MTDALVTAEKLLQVEAVKLRPSEPFTWASGWKSPIYCDNRKILSFPYVRDYIKSELANLVFSEFDGADVIAGVATAGISWGALVADQLKLPFCYVRAQAKEHGLGNQVEGVIEPGQKVVVIEDLISTGISSLQVIDVLRQKGVQIEGLVSIFTYAFPQASQALSLAGVRTCSLTDYPSLIQCGMEKEIIRKEDEPILLQWRENPSQWGR